MTEQAIGGAEDPRLAKAAEIVEYLRQNPSDAYRDTDDLAAQFGADAALVDQLLRSRIIVKKRKKPKFSIKKLLLEIGSIIGRAVLGATVQPLVFLGVVSREESYSREFFELLRARAWCEHNRQSVRDRAAC